VEFRTRIAIAQIQRFELREDRLRMRRVDWAAEMLAIRREQLRRRVSTRTVDGGRVQRWLVNGARSVSAELENQCGSDYDNSTSC
jgi:hypothetical protein